ncbi:MAG: InlB B-repeat-containing protein [Fibromonadaceae bacterium]|nr:InlB B-repeat-containing protein [Fibromonadaceae bacterium]
MAGITSLPLNDKNIVSLDGIEYFTALYYLDVRQNQLSSIDVSKNTALGQLLVFNNQLSAIDVSNNTALTNLNVSDNQLTSIDVSKNTALATLSVGNNQLSIIDVSNNTALTNLNVSGNQLSAIDVSKNTALEILNVGNNQLSSIDVSNNTALGRLFISSNQLSSVDVSNNTALEWLNVSWNYMLSEADVVGLNESITTNFTFLPQRAGKRPISIAFSDGSATYTGSELSHETATVASPNFLPRANPQWTYTYTAITGTLGPASKPLTAGTYSVKARYEDDGNAGEETVTFTVGKALGTTAPNYEPPTDLEANEDQTLEEVQLPPGWAWDEAPATPVGEIGPNPHKATFTPANPNYSIVANINWTINVSAKLYTITFDSDGGSAVDEQKIAKGGKINEPAEPTKEGFTFLGWLSELLENFWDFLNDIVTSNTTLTAVWEAISSSSTNQSSSSETQSSSSEETQSSSSSEEAPSSSSSEKTPSSSSSEETPSSSSSEEAPSSSSSEGSTPILQPPYGRDLSRPSLPLYYDLKGTPLGTTKPTAPGVYIEKHGKHVRKIAVR